MHTSLVRRLSLNEASLRLGIHPFDLVRVLVSLGSFPDDLHLTEEELARVEQLGGLETWWTPDARAEPFRHADPVPLRGMARALAIQLVEHEVIGEASTRLDNLFRGLDPDAQQHARVVLQCMLQAGLVQSITTPSGLNVSVPIERGEDLVSIARGDGMPDSLAKYWQDAL